MNKNRNKVYCQIALFAILLFVTFIRLNVLDFPLERDEGEYAYFAQLILDGVAPYEGAYNMKFPGTYFIYAFFFLLFGETITAIHLGLLIVNLICILLVYKIGQVLLGELYAVFAAMAYAFLSMNPSVAGYATHATHFVSLFALLGFYFLIKRPPPTKPFNKRLYLFASGIFFGLSFIMKQVGLFFICFGGIAVFVFHFFNKEEKKWKQLFTGIFFYVLGVIVPLLLMFIYLFKAKVFDNFWFWTFTYLRAYGTDITNFVAIKEFFFVSQKKVFSHFILVYVFALFGMIILFAKTNHTNRLNRYLIVLFFLISFLTVVPGFRFRVHYYQTFFPAIAFSFAYTLKFIFSIDRLKQLFFVLIIPILGGAFIPFIVSNTDFFINPDVNALSKKRYGLNPFVESIEIGDFLKTITEDDDKILIVGSEPQLYFYSNRPASTGYIYMYPLMETHDYAMIMQKLMIEEVMKNPPKAIVVVNIQTSWLPQPQSNFYIQNWIDQYIREQYYIVGKVDMISLEDVVYKYYYEASIYNLISENNIIIFKRGG